MLSFVEVGAETIYISSLLDSSPAEERREDKPEIAIYFLAAEGAETIYISSLLDSSPAEERRED